MQAKKSADTKQSHKDMHGRLADVPLALAYSIGHVPEVLLVVLIASDWTRLHISAHAKAHAEMVIFGGTEPSSLTPTATAVK
jgi:hypothetical protein